MPSLLFDDRKLLSEKTLTLLVPGGEADLPPLLENPAKDPLTVQIERCYFLTFPKYVLGPL